MDSLNAVEPRGTVDGCEVIGVAAVGVNLHVLEETKNLVSLPIGGGLEQERVLLSDSEEVERSFDDGGAHGEFGEEAGLKKERKEVG